jgi:hypothetical protein
MRLMFFRRKTAKNFTFAQRIEKLTSAGFKVEPGPGGAVRAVRRSLAIDLREEGSSVRALGRAGVLLHGEIGSLVDGGFQKFFRTPSGKQKPALAEDLKALHDFEEDLKEALGQESFYNESLGTVSTLYLYDRVRDRDRGVPKRVWEQ